MNKLRVIDVTDFIVNGSSTDSPKRVQLNASALRSFLGFLTQEGKVTVNLAASVPTVANWRLAQLPQFLESAQVEKLLRSCNKKTSTGRRDRAVLLLLARLGLRAGEVVQLTLESINWEAGEILIRGKRSTEGVTVHLMPTVDYSPQLRRIIAKVLEQVNQEELQLPDGTGRKLRFRLGHRSELRVAIHPGSETVELGTTP